MKVVNWSIDCMKARSPQPVEHQLDPGLRGLPRLQQLKREKASPPQDQLQSRSAQFSGSHRRVCFLRPRHPHGSTLAQEEHGPHSVGPHSVGPHSVGPHSVGPHSVGPHAGGAPMRWATPLLIRQRPSPAAARRPRLPSTEPHTRASDSLDPRAGVKARRVRHRAPRRTPGGRALLVAASLALVTGCSGGKPAFSEAQLLGGKRVPPEVLSQGEFAYMRYCRTCHGQRGRGDGNHGTNLKKRPLDLTEGLYPRSAPEGGLPSDEALGRLIRQGITDSGMPAQHLPPAEAHALIQYLKTLSPRWRSGTPGTEAKGSAAPSKQAPDPRSPPTPRPGAPPAE